MAQVFRRPIEFSHATGQNEIVMKKNEAGILQQNTILFGMIVERQWGA
jgi:hypothetical protein